MKSFWKKLKGLQQQQQPPPVAKKEEDELPPPVAVVRFRTSKVGEDNNYDHYYDHSSSCSSCTSETDSLEGHGMLLMEESLYSWACRHRPTTTTQSSATTPSSSTAWWSSNITCLLSVPPSERPLSVSVDEFLATRQLRTAAEFAAYWFELLNRHDLQGLVRLCARDCTIVWCDDDWSLTVDVWLRNVVRPMLLLLLSSSSSASANYRNFGVDVHAITHITPTAAAVGRVVQAGRCRRPWGETLATSSGNTTTTTTQRCEDGGSSSSLWGPSGTPPPTGLPIHNNNNNKFLLPHQDPQSVILTLDDHGYIARYEIRACKTR